MALLVKTVNGLAYASVKTRNGLAVASIKSINGLDAAGVVITASDNFTRANENPIVGIVGCLWTNGITGYNSMELNSNIARSTVAAIGGAIVTTPDFTAYPNHSATVTLGTNNQSPGCFVRMTVSGNGYRLNYNSGSSVRISLITAGVASAIGADFGVSAPANGVTLKLEVNGTTLTAYRNGVSLGSRTDSTYSSGSPGMMTGGTTPTLTAFSCTSL